MVVGPTTVAPSAPTFPPPSHCVGRKMTPWHPAAEPWRKTALRTGSLALAIGFGVGLYQRRIEVVALATLAALWFTLGGHFAEVFFLNRLRHRIGSRVAVRAEARLIYWFVAGSILYAGALTTLAILTGRSATRWAWWAGGAFFWR